MWTATFRPLTLAVSVCLACSFQISFAPAASFITPTMLSRISTAARAQRPYVAAANRTTAVAAASSNRTLTTMMQSAAAFRFVPQWPRSSSISAVATAGSADTVRRVHLSAQPQQQQQQPPPSRFEGPPGWAAPPRPSAEFADRYPPLRKPRPPLPWSHRMHFPVVPAAPLFSFRPPPLRIAFRRLLFISLLYFSLWAWGTAPDAEDEKAIRAARMSGWPRPLVWFLGQFFEDMIQLGFTSRKHFPRLAEAIYSRAAAAQRAEAARKKASAFKEAPAAAAKAKAQDSESAKKKDGQ